MSWWNHRHLLGYAYDETVPPKVTSPATSLGGQNAAIWLAQKISIFWWDFPSDSKLTTANIWPVTETRFCKHTRQIWLGGLVGEHLAEKPSHHSGLNIAQSFNDLFFRTWWTLRVVNFKSDEKSDHSIDIFSTNQNAPFWRIFNKIDKPTYLWKIRWKIWWICDVLIFLTSS
jgi:hypothetical protein